MFGKKKDDIPEQQSGSTPAGAHRDARDLPPTDPDAVAAHPDAAYSDTPRAGAGRSDGIDDRPAGDPHPTLAEEIQAGEFTPTPIEGDRSYDAPASSGYNDAAARRYDDIRNRQRGERDLDASDASYDARSAGRDHEQVRHDGVGPTDYADDSTRSFAAARDDATHTYPAVRDDSTRTFAAARDDDLSDGQRNAAAVGALGAAGAAGAAGSRHDYVDPDRTATLGATDSPYDDTRHDARPEDRFVTGQVADRDGDGIPDRVEDDGVVKNGFHIPKIGGWLLGLVRILIGWQFLWAFLDKTFGLGFGTPSERSWINGGKPTAGFLGGVVDDPNNPFQPMFKYFLDQGWTDWLFMIGLLGIGLVLILGLGKILTWVAALSGVALLILMYLAAWPAGHGKAAVGADGQAATNPFLDDHLLNAVVLLALAACNAGAYLGLAKAWRTRRAYKDA